MAREMNTTKRPDAPMLIAERFNSRTLANMEVALDRACKILRAGSQQHEARRHIANRILECANGGDVTLGGLTEAACAAAVDPVIYGKKNRRRDSREVRDPSGSRGG